MRYESLDLVEVPGVFVLFAYQGLKVLGQHGMYLLVQPKGVVGGLELKSLLALKF